MNALPETVRQRAAAVRLISFDVDGVLTDGRIIYTDAGDEIKCFHVRDGHGLRLMEHAGITVALITGRQSRAVAHRAQNLGLVHVHQGVRDKLGVLGSLQQSLEVAPRETAVVGDDLVDLAMMQRAGLAIAVADAPVEVKDRAHWITSLGGGRGAVREVCELILKAQGKWESLLSRYLAH
jgi:3-deoxy-D-manno-octulosonate 8-phosphate phosphatase (KDO 8-P phosphatase)